MKFIETALKGAYIIELENREDDRGFFARFFCINEFRDKGLDSKIAQINNSYSIKRGTLRGMHYQLHPHAETKVIRCISGSVYDVIIDLRTDSNTFGNWHGELLSAENRKALYVPKGFAHGFITMEDHSEVFYLVSEFYDPSSERGIKWNDKKFKIKWPLEPIEISDKDKNHPDFDVAYHLNR